MGTTCITINNQSIIHWYANYKYLVYPFCQFLKMLHLFRTYSQFWPFDHNYHKYNYLYLHLCDIWACDLCSVDTQVLIGQHMINLPCASSRCQLHNIRTAKLHTSSFLRFRLQVQSDPKGCFSTHSNKKKNCLYGNLSLTKQA